MPVFWLSLIGLPAKRFAWPLDNRPWRSSLPYVGRSKRPDWDAQDTSSPWALFLSLSWRAASRLWSLASIGRRTRNDDWGNYNLGAMRFIEHGMLDKPDVAALGSGTGLPKLLLLSVCWTRCPISFGAYAGRGWAC